MDILGYVVTKTKVQKIMPYIKVVTSFRQIEDKSKPILIIGLEEAKKNASFSSILEKQLEENVFWTFGKREKRTDYERDISNFQQMLIKRSINTIKYYYVNLLTISWKKIKSLIKIVKSNDEKYFFVDKDMIYMYYDNYIVGISKEIIVYLGFKLPKIMKIITNNNKNHIMYGDKTLNYEIKQLISNKRYMSAYFSAFEEEKE